jgi:hypothetical protein
MSHASGTTRAPSASRRATFETCPWCGGLPEWACPAHDLAETDGHPLMALAAARATPALRALACLAVDCRVKPHTPLLPACEESDAALVQIWNGRATPRDFRGTGRFAALLASADHNVRRLGELARQDGALRESLPRDGAGQ